MSSRSCRQKLNRTEFEKIVKEGVKAIPERFLGKLDNVAIVIEAEPTSAQKKKLNIHPNWTLFGLYEGVPQARRGINYSAVLPDKITIFQKPIEMAARNEKDIKEMVKNTVWHEIAHHFGMSELEVRQSEARRRKTPKDNSSAPP
ncbi:MAG: metallopeptidase family protein [Candidatus Doudnabacteria bacterium]